MVGLRTQENSKFLKFWDIVQAEARKQKKTFFLDCGEGHDFENETIECEDLSGWLIPDNQLQEFQELFLSRRDIGVEWEDEIAFAIWQIKDNKIIVTFE